MSDWRFIYRAQWIESYDGDTPTLLIDKGLRDYSTIEVRVNGLWCPEISQSGGQESKSAAEHWFRSASPFGLQWPIMVELTSKISAGRAWFDGDEVLSFTRYVGDIYDSNMNSFAQWMIDNGYGTRTR